MHKLGWVLAVSGLALTGCGQEDASMSSPQAEPYAVIEAAEETPENQFGFVEAMENSPVVERVTTVDIEEAGAGATEASNENAIPVSIPQIAYIYDYGFRLDGADIPALQERHVKQCEELGSQVCQVLEMRSSGDEGDYAYGNLNLAVAAGRARAFGADLGESAEEAGGEQVSASISGEDLSKQIVDTEARLRARSVLRDRLMEVLRNRQGTVAELVEAERGVAQVNEEIDQAQSWLAEMRGRVEFSRLNIEYNGGAPSGGGFVEPVREALGSLGTFLGVILAAFLYIVVGLIPLLALVLGGRWVWLRAVKPLWRRVSGVAETPEVEA